MNAPEELQQELRIDGRSAVRRPCPCCGHENQATAPSRYSEGAWPLKRCSRCGFVYIGAAPVYEELFEEHAWEKTSAVREQDRRRRYPLLYRISKSTRWRLHLFPRKRVEDLLVRHARPGNVLDVGCGRGGQLEKLPPRFVPFGVEISRAEAAHAQALFRRRKGGVVVKPALEGLAEFPEGYFSAVLMRSYLEHEAEPRGVLAGVRRVLRADGIAIIKVPNYGSLNRVLSGRRWCGFRFPDHLNYFTPASLRRMCGDCGLEVRRFGFFDRLPVSDNMWMVVGPGRG